MAKAFDRNDAHSTDSAYVPRERKLDWRKRMSDNIAYALLVYTALQIWVTVHALKTGAEASMLLPPNRPRSTPPHRCPTAGWK